MNFKTRIRHKILSRTNLCCEKQEEEKKKIIFFMSYPIGFRRVFKRFEFD